MARQASREIPASNKVKLEGTRLLYANDLQVDIRLTESHMNFKFGSSGVSVRVGTKKEKLERTGYRGGMLHAR